ncbi:MAG TPA: DUF3088 family protein [Candidatus Thermoplasmatota archaeon]|nr:DUF3088 family protein [Candidatus Thermoplasmatota archaeon]
MPTKDRLYLLKPDFAADGMRQFCSECAMVEGMLSFYPHLRQSIDIRYIGFTKPRPEIVAEIGPEHQSSPCLVIGDPARAKNLPMGVKVQTSNGRSFVDDPLQVCEYLAQVHGTGRPRA